MAIVALTFLVIIGIVLGAYYMFVVRPEAGDRATLLRRLGGREAEAGTMKLEALETRDRQLSQVRAIQALLSRANGLSGPLDRMVTQSGLKITVGTVLMASALLALVGYLLVKSVTYYTFLFVRHARTKRLETFEEQFPEAIDLMARALRAGHAFPTGLLMVAEETPNPVAAEFKLVYDRQNFGMPMSDALKGMADRVPVLDAKFFATAVLTQRETGGNLAEILDNLSTVIRDRFKVKRQVRVLTAHGRITGWILAALPPSLAVILIFVAPDHMKTMISDPLGVQMMVVGGAMQVIGTLIIRKVVQIRY
jgi:tight adherence protein B